MSNETTNVVPSKIGFATIKEAFGSELSFTKFISEDLNIQQAIFDAIGFKWKPSDNNVEVSHQDEIYSGRIDNVIYYNGDPQVVVETMLGKMDQNHLGRIPLYMGAKGVNCAVIICEKDDPTLREIYQNQLKNNIIFLIPTIYCNPKPDFRFDVISKSKIHNIKKSNTPIENDDLYVVLKYTNSKTNETYIQSYMQYSESRTRGYKLFDETSEGIEAKLKYLMSNTDGSGDEKRHQCSFAGRVAESGGIEYLKVETLKIGSKKECNDFKNQLK